MQSAPNLNFASATHVAPMPKLLMIEDDARLADMVGVYLRGNGFEFVHAPDGRQGLTLLGVDGAASKDGRASPALPDLLLLDLMLPDMSGLDICKRIRNASGSLAELPVLMLTAKGDPMDRIVGLELGADDYLPKPFEPRELVARIHAVLRRRVPGAARGQPMLRFGSLEIDLDARSVTVDGQPRELTSHQFDLLRVLAERAGRVLTRDQIMEAVRGRELEAFDRSIDVHVGRIRQAVEVDPKAPKRILTVRGVGYVFSRQQD